MDEEAVYALWREYFLAHNAFLEKEKLLVIADALAQLFTMNSTTEEEEQQAIRAGKPTARRIIRLMLETNLSAIYDHTESPIEKMFLVAVQFISALRGPRPIQFITPKNRAEDYPAFFANRYKSVIKQWQAYQQETGNREVCDFLRAVDYFYRSEQMSVEAHDEIAALAEFERDIISERTQAGLEAARARGRKGGRPKATAKISPAQLARAKELYAAKQNSVAEIMALTGFKSRNTFYKYVVNGTSQHHKGFDSTDTMKPR